MNNRHIDLYMDLATRIALMSHAVRLKVGSVIVKNNSIISFGWNGMPSGWDNNCEDEIGHVLDDANNIVETRLKTKQEVLHAESNALMKVASSTESSENSTMFCTHAPCIHCAKLIYQSGINSLYYRNTYRDTAGLEFLEKSGVSVTQYCT